MKRKISQILLFTLICTNLLACSDNKPINNLEQAETSNEATEIVSEITTENVKATYKELSLNSIEEYTYARSTFKAKPNEIGYINIVHDDFVGTLNFTNSTIKPSNFYYDSLKFGAYSDFGCIKGPYEDNSTEEKLDASFIQNVIGDLGQAYFYKTENGYRTIIAYDDIHWHLSTNYIEEDEAKEDILAIVKCINREYVPDAPSTSEYVKNAVNNLELDTVSFDFSNYELTTEAYVYFKEDNGYKIYNIDMLGLKSLETNKYVSMNLWNGSNVSSKIQSTIDVIKSDTAKLYEVNVANQTIRVYERTGGVPFYLGFVSEDTEYLTPINTDMNIDELVGFLEETIITE